MHSLLYVVGFIFLLPACLMLFGSHTWPYGVLWGSGGILIVVLVVLRARAKIERAKDRFLASVDAPIDYIHTDGRTVIAISVARRALYLSDKKATATYPPDRIRRWGWEIPGKFEYVGLSAASLQASENDNQAANSGIWVEVMDVDRPRWFLWTGINRPLMQRWKEILEQFTEGTLQPQPGGPR